MSKGRGKKGGDVECKALKSLHGNLKTMERGGSWVLWKMK